MPDDDGGAPAEVPTGPDASGGAPPAAEPTGPTDDAVAARLAEIATALAELTGRQADATERAAARERVIDRQHAEIERLRTDERFGLLQPVLVDLCALRNDLLRQAGSLKDGFPVERMAELLHSFAASVEETLLRCGVEPQPREVGVAFAPRRQRVVRIVEVDDPERDGTVAEIVQDGYAELGDEGRVVVPARVAVHRAVTADRNATKEHVDV